MTGNENEQHEQETLPEQREQESGTNAEAAKYRRRLREVEAERDRLVEQVGSLRRAEVERQVADRLQDPSDLWRAGVELDDLLDEDGGIDGEKLDETVSSVTEQHPGWRKRELTGFDEDQGKTSEQPAGASWSALLRSQ